MIPMALGSETYILAALANTSAAVTLTAPSTANKNVILTNLGTTSVFVTSGVTSPTAVYPTSASVPVAGQVLGPGVMTSFSKPVGHAFIAAIRPSATAGDLVITVGEGE